MGQNSFWISIAPSFVQTERRSISMSATLQTRELVDEVNCIVDANYSLLHCIFFVYQSEVSNSFIFNYERIQFRPRIELLCASCRDKNRCPSIYKRPVGLGRGLGTPRGSLGGPEIVKLPMQ